MGSGEENGTGNMIEAMLPLERLGALANGGQEARSPNVENPRSQIHSKIADVGQDREAEKKKKKG